MLFQKNFFSYNSAVHVCTGICAYMDTMLLVFTYSLKLQLKGSVQEIKVTII